MAGSPGGGLRQGASRSTAGTAGSSRLTVCSVATVSTGPHTLMRERLGERGVARRTLARRGEHLGREVLVALEVTADQIARLRMRGCTT